MVKLYALLAFSLVMSSALALPVGRISSLNRRDLVQEFPRRELEHPLDARDTDYSDDLEARKFDFSKALDTVKSKMRIGSGKKVTQQQNVGTGSQTGSEHHNNNADSSHHNNNAGSSRPQRAQNNIYNSGGRLTNARLNFRHSTSDSTLSGHSNAGGAAHHDNNVANSKPKNTGKAMIASLKSASKVLMKLGRRK